MECEGFAAYKFAFTASGKSAETFYRRIFGQAHRQGIDLRVLISPSHARQWAVVSSPGLWATWEDWKRMLVRINEDEAAKAGKHPFPLWGFSGFNSITTERFPALGDTQTKMRGYWESSHYKKETDGLVLDRIFGRATPERPVPADFGVLLDSKKLETHLDGVRVLRDE